MFRPSVTGSAVITDTLSSILTTEADRLMDHAHVCQTTGEGIRMSRTLTGKGVIPTELATTGTPMATTGQIWWPSAGRTHCRHRADADVP